MSAFGVIASAPQTMRLLLTHSGHTPVTANVNPGRHERPAALAHPALALQRKSALGARLQAASRTGAACSGPDYLIRVWRATGQGKLPVLWLDGRAIADSTRIIATLEEHYPDPSLYPRDAAMRQRALTLEDDLDETLEPALRAAIVTPLFQHDPDIALRVLTTGMGGKAYHPRCGRCLGFFQRSTDSAIESARSNLERDRAIVAAAL